MTLIARVCSVSVCRCNRVSLVDTHTPFSLSLSLSHDQPSFLFQAAWKLRPPETNVSPHNSDPLMKVA